MQSLQRCGKVESHSDRKDHTQADQNCREDVAATGRLLNAVRTEFDCHPFDLWPDKAYSPASIAKAYLDDMNIAHPNKHFKVANKIHGIAMQAYNGGRAECRIRKTPVPVILTDFTSQYPTVNALLGNWSVLKASSIRLKSCAGEVRKLLSKLELKWEGVRWRSLSSRQRTAGQAAIANNASSTVQIAVNLPQREPQSVATPNSLA